MVLGDKTPRTSGRLTETRFSLMIVALMFFSESMKLIKRFFFLPVVQQQGSKRATITGGNGKQRTSFGDLLVRRSVGSTAPGFESDGSSSPPPNRFSSYRCHRL